MFEHSYYGECTCCYDLSGNLVGTKKTCNINTLTIASGQYVKCAKSFTAPSAPGKYKYKCIIHKG